MNYSNGTPILIGDNVLVEGNVIGIVVCDFDNKKSTQEFSDWDPAVQLNGGGSLSTGILIKTTELGLIHYPTQDNGIVFVNRE